MNNRKSSKKVWLGAIGLALLLTAFAGIYFMFREKPAAGAKAVVIEVVNQAEESVKYQVQTDAQFLRQAMEEAKDLTFSGEETEYGMMVDTVNGLKADYNADGAYWAFFVNGEYCMYGIDEQPVEAGDQFSIVYTAAQ